MSHQCNSLNIFNNSMPALLHCMDLLLMVLVSMTCIIFNAFEDIVHLNPSSHHWCTTEIFFKSNNCSHSAEHCKWLATSSRIQSTKTRPPISWPSQFWRYVAHAAQELSDQTLYYGHFAGGQLALATWPNRVYTVHNFTWWRKHSQQLKYCNSLKICHLPDACYMLCQLNLFWINNPNDTWWSEQSKTSPDVYFSLSSCHFCPLWSKYSPQHPVLTYPLTAFSFPYDDKVQHPQKTLYSFIIKETHRQFLFQNEKERQQLQMGRRYYNVPCRNSVAEVGRINLVQVRTNIADSCTHDHEPWHWAKGTEFLEVLSNYQILKKNSPPCS
jgi:hypothetical protein